MFPFVYMCVRQRCPKSDVPNPLLYVKIPTKLEFFAHIKGKMWLTSHNTKDMDG